MAASISKRIMQAGPGRSTLIGGSIVLAGLGGLYIIMLRNTRKQEEKGTRPYYEQVMARVNKKPEEGEELHPLRTRLSDMPPALPGKEHYSGHATRSNWKSTQGYDEQGDNVRLMQPTPQREGREGRPYTKSPDYVKNYGKTQRPPPQRVAEI